MTMNTPAIKNQYGEMYTGMPNGRPMTIPRLASRRCGCFWFWFCGVLATIPIVRAGHPPECRWRALRFKGG
jgi:hypothetical protein